jgi:putative methyltransferase (TIGR04325 family)
MPEWEYVPEGWERTRGEDATGLAGDAEQLARAYADKWPEFLKAVDGPGPLGIYHEVPAGRPIEREDPLAQNTVLAWAYALARVAGRERALSVLDWGGALGHYYVLARAVLPGVELDYHCREVPAVCAEGRRLLPEVTFHEDDDCLEDRYDLVFASGSLQYDQNWRARIRAFTDATRGWLLITRVPLACTHQSFVVLQRAYAYGYGTEYIGWVLNRDELLAAAGDCGLTLVREFVLLWPHEIDGAPEPVGERGFLFRRTEEQA